MPRWGPALVAGWNGIRPSASHAGVTPPPRTAYNVCTNTVPPRTSAKATAPVARIPRGKGDVAPRTSGGPTCSSVVVDMPPPQPVAQEPAQSRGLLGQFVRTRHAEG